MQARADELEEWLLFSTEQVSDLAELSARRLAYWDQTRFFPPRYLAGRGRYYSFRDLVGLRTISMMRKAGIPLRGLREIGAFLKKSYDTPWSSLTFYVSGKKPYFRDPKTGQIVTHQPEGQTAFQKIALTRIAHQMRRKADALRHRRARDRGKIVRQRNVAHNASVLAGTRIPTAAIFSFSEAGYSPEDILREYPTLTRADIERAIKYERARQRQAS